MKNLKKVLALVLSLAMIVSTFTVSFAAEEKTDAEICEALGMLQGEGNGVTDEYLAKSTTRFQAALMFLRLQGLEDEALAFEGTETFEDAEDLQWVAGRSVLAYLKANPELGWVGTGKGFMPNGAITAQAYYKVMLEAIGYEYKVDFEWAEVLEFAATKGLVAAAEVEDFTNNDIAVVTVETLNAENSDGVVLINKLVEDGVIADTDAELIDNYVAPVTAKMEAAKAIDSTTIMVSFDEAVEVTADDFAVVAGDKEFAVSAVKSADAGKVAVLTVAELTVGSKYTVTSGEVSKTVVPTIKDDKTKPVIKSAEAITGEVVNVVLSTRNINQDTLVGENFSLNNDATVLSAELNVEDMKLDTYAGQTVVTLTVSGLKNGKAYTVKSSGVESYEGLTADVDASKATFAGKDKDTKAPKLKSAKSIGGYQVEVVFDEATTLDVDTASSLENYSITPELAITDVKIKKNVIGNKGYENVVVLTTADQKSGTAYTLKVDNISDGTNVMKEAEKTVFAGLKKVTNQTATAAKANDATKVQVTFGFDCNDTALDIANYEMDKDIQVVSAEFKEDLSAQDKMNKQVVILTTTEMKSSTAYTLTVKTGVQDILGQGLKEAKKLVFAGVDKDSSFTTTITAKAKNKTTVTVTFGEEVDRATAMDVANYSISDLGYPSNVSLDSAGLVATLTVQEQEASKAYTITLNNIKDKADNVVKADTKVKFTGIGDIVTTVAVKEVAPLSEKLIKVVFNQKIIAASGNITFTLKENDGDALTGLGSPYEVTVTAPTAATDTVVITLPGSVKMTSSEVYKLVLTNLGVAKGSVTDHVKSTTASDCEKTFVGSSASAPTFALTGAIAIDQKHIKLLFDNNVSAVDGATVQLFANDALDADAKYTDDTVIGVIALDDDDSGSDNAEIVNKKEVIVTLTKALKDSSIYYVSVGNLASVQSSPASITLAEYATGKGKARATLSTGDLEDPATKKLAIESIAMFNANVLEVKFSTDVKAVLTGGTAAEMLTASDFQIFKGDTEVTSSVKKIVRKPGTENTFYIYVEKASEMGDTSGMAKLKLTGSATSLKTKLGDNAAFASEGNEKSFAVTTTAKDKPAIASASAVNDYKIKVLFNDDVFTTPTKAHGETTDLTAADFVIVNADDNIKIATSALTVEPIANDSKAVYISLAGGKFLAAKDYRIAIANGRTVYSVDGINTIEASAVVNTNPKSDITKYETFGGVASEIAIATAANLVITDTQITGNASAALAGSTIKVVANDAAVTAGNVGSATPTVIADGSFAAITGLTATTDYDVYVISTDGSVSAKLDITTLAALAGNVTVAVSGGATSGTTKVTITGAAASGNEYVYKISDAEVTGVRVDITITDGVAITGTEADNVTITANKYITVYEINSTTKNVVNFRSVQVTAGDITP